MQKSLIAHHFFCLCRLLLLLLCNVQSISNKSMPTFTRKSNWIDYFKRSRKKERTKEASTVALRRGEKSSFFFLQIGSVSKERRCWSGWTLKATLSLGEAPRVKVIGHFFLLNSGTDQKRRRRRRRFKYRDTKYYGWLVSTH